MQKYIVGSNGIMLLKLISSEKEDRIGPYTGAVYKFSKNPILYVDSNDAIFMLGPDFDLLEK